MANPRFFPLPPGARQMSSDMDHQLLLCWERFLHKKSIRVLLVETDDSTRNVIAAMLRHCMYQVIPAENEQQAWAYLQGMHNNIDLVLSEVVGPEFELLNRIMDHSVCKNIPVIMMSCSDSMGTVFNCLSKGAVHFLHKPIRKSELKNLWQHVWRRCQRSSGSGSGRQVQTHKCTKPKSGDEPNKYTGSNDRNEDASTGLDARDGSDNAQSSWTKRAVEIDSPHPLSQDQSTDPPDSTFAHVIRPWLPGTRNKKCNNRKETNDEFKVKELEIGDPSYVNTDDQSCLNGSSIKQTDRRCEYPPQNSSNASTMESLEETIVRAADLIGPMTKNMDTQQATRAKYAPNCSSKVPSLELSLKRSRSTGDGANAIQDKKRKVLSGSDLLPFTKYITSNQGGAVFVGSRFPQGTSSEAVKMGCPYSMKSSSDAGVLKQDSKGSSSNNDLGSTTKNVVTKPGGNKVSPINGVQQWKYVAAGNDKADEVGKKNTAGGKDEADEAESKHPCAVHGGSAGVPQSNVTDPWAPVEDGSNSGSNNNTNNGSTAAPAVNVKTNGVDKRRGGIMNLKGQHLVAALNRYKNKNFLSGSDLSAFIRYNTCAVSNQSSDAGLMKQGSNSNSCNHNDMGSTTNNMVTKPGGNKVSPINDQMHTLAFDRVQWTPVAAGKDKANEVGKSNAARRKYKGGETKSKHTCVVHDENGAAAGVPQSNAIDPWAPVEGCNSGSNKITYNGSTAAATVNVETGGADKISGDIMYLKGEHRAAAMNRYREKKKERNFMKKVRYQSRKSQAEQRLRVRGQFVRRLPPATAALEW